MQGRYRLGIDENGLGSRLGPLMVTGVGARVSSSAAKQVESRELTGAAALVGDSKRLVSHDDVRLGEAWTRVLLGEDADTPAALVARGSLTGVIELQSVCPASARAQCWLPRGEAFLASSALVSQVREERTRLARLGIAVDSVKFVINCTGYLNTELAAGRHRFQVDLHAMERLILAFRQECEQDLLAVCGKVGGIAQYPKFFGPLAGRLYSTVEEGSASSRYRLPGVGEVAFIRDADALDPLVMLASLVGKYLRELLMARIARAYPDVLGDGRLASGYHDPVTARFVEATAAIRSKRGLPITCFERSKK